MERAYNITFKKHHRTSLWLKDIPNCIVYAKNKDSAKELGQAIVRDLYKGNEYMVKQYSYIISREN